MDDIKIFTIFVMWMFVLLGVYTGCEECDPGEEKCSADYYHMICIENDYGGGNWTIKENCRER